MRYEHEKVIIERFKTAPLPLFSLAYELICGNI